MQLVELIALENGPVSLALLNARTGVPKTSLTHMLRALEDADYVVRTAAGYALGSSSYRMAAAVGRIHDFSAVIGQVLQQVAAQTRETVLLGKATPDRRGGIYVDRVASPQPVRFTPDLNEVRPLHCTALGKVLLAWSAPSELDAYLREEKLERFTAHTITRKAALRSELDEVRATGFARSLDEMVEGGGAVAVPVRDGRGDVAFALVIAAPTHRILPNESAWIALLARQAQVLSSAGIR